MSDIRFQVARARQYTKEAGLENQVKFVKGDFMKLAEQFGENSFDAVYAIEATVHAPSWQGVYGEIMKVLKPGGIVSSSTISTLSSFTDRLYVYSSACTSGA